jgi:hypothetical protein
MTAYYDILMDTFQRDDFITFRSQALKYRSAVSPEEWERILAICKNSEDWSKNFWTASMKKRNGTCSHCITYP